VYGRLPETTGLTSIAQFTVDNGPPFISEYPPSNDDVQYDPISKASSNYRLYSNQFLSSGKHTLIITAQAANALWLDYAIVGTGADLSNAGDSVTTFPASQGSTQTIVSTGKTRPYSTASGAASSPSSLSSSTRPAAIAGGTAGAICLALAILGIVYYLWRRRRWDSDPDAFVLREVPPYLGRSNLL
jgi:hypothetical protein